MGSRVVIKQREAVEMTPGGLAIPVVAQKAEDIGTIVAVGPGNKDKHGKPIPLTLKVGDEVIYSRYSGTEMEMNGQKVVIMDESAVYAVRSL